MLLAVLDAVLLGVVYRFEGCLKTIVYFSGSLRKKGCIADGQGNGVLKSGLLPDFGAGTIPVPCIGTADRHGRLTLAMGKSMLVYS